MRYPVLTLCLSLVAYFSCSCCYGQQKDTTWHGKTPTQLLQKGKSQVRTGAILFGIGAAMMGWVVLDYSHGNARDEGETRAKVFILAIPVTAAGITLFSIGVAKKHKAKLLLAFDGVDHRSNLRATKLSIGLAIPFQ